MSVLEKRDTRISTRSDLRGMLRPQDALSAFSLTRFAPTDSIADLVERYWVITWDLPAGVSHTQDVLSYPCIDLVFERGTARVWGARTRRLRRRLTGAGWAFGVKFRPGGFTPLAACSIARLTNRSMPADRALTKSAGVQLLAVCRAIEQADSPAARARIVDDWLTGLTIDRSSSCPELSDLVRLAFHDTSIATVTDLAQRSGMSIRMLQRRVHEQIGLTPKAVLTTLRLMTAAQVLDAGSAELARLAADAGYADQSHFTNDFRARVGTTPGRYRRRKTGHDRLPL